MTWHGFQLSDIDPLISAYHEYMIRHGRDVAEQQTQLR
jgi:hypothetical protein